MKLQQFEYSCGPACIVNAIRCYGEKVREQDVRTYSNTDLEEGTDDVDVIAALEALGYRGKLVEKRSQEDSWWWLKEQLLRGHPVICAVDGWSHYVTAIGVLGSSVVVFDTQLVNRVRDENGCFVYSREEFMERWYFPKMKLCSGIVVKKK